MIVEEFVNIHLTSTNERHFRRKNYKIPKVKNKYDIVTFAKHKTLKVLVVDLPLWSTLKVHRKCACGRIDYRGYRDVVRAPTCASCAAILRHKKRKESGK